MSPTKQSLSTDKEEDVLTSSLLQLFLPAPALQSVALRGRLASRVKEMLLVAFSLPPLTFFDTAAKISILRK